MNIVDPLCPGFGSRVLRAALEAIPSTKNRSLAALEFPPKKLFGNKDERVIAERRSHLEVTGRSCVAVF
ncbi:UNVERIFIED_CONTAM: hypothetical protein FKN15_069587 [Acipenser sinensis]